MSTIAAVITALVERAAQTAGLVDERVPLEPAVSTNDSRFGHYQSNHAFRLAKVVGRNPREVAAELVAALPAHPAVAKVDVAGPGFVNFTLDDAWLGVEVARRARDPRFHGPQPGEGLRLVIDYSSPNIAKRMHVGHIRSTIIGNALDRMYRYLGYEVIADNHLGDWGTPVGKLIVAWHRWRDDDAYAADPVGELQRLYQLFGDEAKTDPALGDAARAETAKLQSGDPDNRALWRAFVDVSMDELNSVYRRMDVHFDEVLGESAYQPMLDDALAAMVEAGLAVPSDGALIVPFTAEDGKGLADKTLVVRKSDGAATYGTTDVATVRYRMERWDPARILYVTDVRQKEHFQQIFAIARKLGITAELEHVWFGMLRFPGGAVAASRTAGASINLVDVLDEAARRAREVVDAHADDIPDEAERAAVAETVGIGAVKYADLSQNPQTDIIFEWDKVLSLQGNTAPYLMYAHARCCSLLRKGDVVGFEPVDVTLGTPEERDLALAIARLPEAILLAANTARPNLLAEHLYGLAQTYGKFYVACPVLKEDVPGDVRASRLSLVVASQRALRLGLGLLGMGAPERM